jgi:hypothetical protein
MLQTPCSKADAGILETRICNNIIDLTASIAVDTMGNDLTWDNSVMNCLDEPDEAQTRFVVDEMCDELNCDEDIVLQAMTCLRLICERRELVRVQCRGISDKESMRVLEVARKIIELYGLEQESGPPQEEDEETSEAAEDLAQNIYGLLCMEHLFKTCQVYNGRVLYSCADREYRDD